MVRLESVFWDHPEFANEPGVRGFLAANPDTADRVWMLTRFLEHGRFVDTVLFFTLGEIREKLPQVRISDVNRRKWARFLDVYAVR
jgi:hypothetical protein